MDAWHFTRDGQAHGPVGFAELIVDAMEGRLRPDDLVWTQSFTDWRPAATIPALFPDGRNPPARRAAEPLAIGREDRFDIESAPFDTRQPAPAQGGGGLVGRNWRGELPLWQSFWICGVLLGLVVRLAATLVERTLLPHIIFDARLFWSVIAVTVAIPLVIAYWQWTGIWRSARRHAQALGRFSLWAALASLAVVVGVLSTVAALVQLAQSLSEFAPALLSASRFPPATVSLQGETLVISGTIGLGSGDLVARSIEDRVVSRVVLDSGGGLIAEGQSIARQIASRGARTHVARRCHSACTFVFLAGSRRTLGVGAQLGFHAPAFFDRTRPDAAALADFRRDYSAAGLPEPFLQRVMATPNDQMLTPEPRELIALGIVHEVVADRGEVAAALRTGAALAALERLDRPRFEAFLETFMAAVRSGAPYEELLTQARTSFSRVSGAYLARADDDIVLEVLAVAEERDRWLMERDPETCVAYQVASAGARPRVPLEERRDLLERIDALAARVIENGARSSRPPPDPRTAQTLMLLIVERVARSPGADFESLVRENAGPADYPVMCRTAVALYAAIRTLPRAQQAMIYRHMSVEASR